MEISYVQGRRIGCWSSGLDMGLLRDPELYMIIGQDAFVDQL